MKKFNQTTNQQEEGINTMKELELLAKRIELAREDFDAIKEEMIADLDYTGQTDQYGLLMAVLDGIHELEREFQRVEFESRVKWFAGEDE